MTTLVEARLTPSERRALEAVVDTLRERFGADLVSVWLYGSRARGEDTGPESDIDLLVITTGGRKRDFRAVQDAVAAGLERAEEPFLPVAAIVWDPERLADRRRIESFFVQEVDRDKIVLYGGGAT